MKKFLVFMSMALMFSGCASIISGSKQSISVTSNVEGATVSIVDVSNNKETLLGKTPFIGEAPRYKSAKLVVKKDGFKSAEILLTVDTNYVFLIGAISLGYGLTSTSTDFSTGAIYKYAPNSYMANLEPGSKSANNEQFKKESSMRVFALLNYDRICNDLAAGNGKYLDSIYGLYGAKSEAAKNDVAAFVKDAQATTQSAPEFAQKLSARM